MKRVLAVILFGICILMSMNSPGKAQQSQQLIFRNQVVMDSQFLEMEAYRLLVPQDWIFNGGVTWNFSKNPPEPFSMYTISSPDGLSVIQQFPHMNMYWSQDQMSQQAYAQSGATILQPLGAIDFLQSVFIPQTRQGVSDLRVLETQPLEALAQHTLQVNNMMLDIFGRISPFTFPYETRADAARVKVEYTRDGRRIIEDFTATVNYFISHLQTMYGMPLTSISWTPAVSSFRAPAEEMPGKIKMFQIALFSRFDNPLWNVSYTRLAATITRENLRQQQAIFDRWQQIRQTQQEIDDIIMKTYQNRSRSYDRIFDNYSQAVRGVDKYIDPVNNWDIELPTGYDNAWTNGSEYVFSDSPNFDPNVGTTVNWHKMDRKP